MATNSDFIIKNGVTVSTTDIINSSGVWIGNTLNIKGAAGAQGVQGSPGPAGSTGATGAQGAQGRQGSQGATGSPGPAGVAGVAGAQGAQGRQGVAGASGAQGAQGVQGAVGAQGIAGASGVAGLSGRAGAQGAQGAQGPAGVAGVAGSTGPAGVAGVAGAPGAQGAAGAQGVQGAQGATGSTGPTGFPGALGAGGLTGVPGAQGAPGTPSSLGTTVPALGVNTAAGPTGTLRATGNITAYFSDIRLKDNIEYIKNAGSMLYTLRGVLYTMNEISRHLTHLPDRVRVGVIAQEVQKILPEIVKPAPFDIGADGNSISGENYLTVQYSKLIPLVVETIKEQQKEIEYLEKIIG